MTAALTHLFSALQQIRMGRQHGGRTTGISTVWSQVEFEMQQWSPGHGANGGVAEVLAEIETKSCSGRLRRTRRTHLILQGAETTEACGLGGPMASKSCRVETERGFPLQAPGG